MPIVQIRPTVIIKGLEEPQNHISVVLIVPLYSQQIMTYELKRSNQGKWELHTQSNNGTWTCKSSLFKNWQEVVKFLTLENLQSIEFFSY